MNKRFLAFAKLLEEASEWSKNKIEVDIPEDALSFTGCPQKQVVKIRPTKECLVALSEFPFFVLDVNEIEIFHFERMFYGMKNFDLAVIKKDFTTCLRINSIPMEYAEEIKSYINDIGVIFIESMAPLKWDLILNQIKEDFNEWLEQGAWLQFVEVSKSKLHNQSTSANHLFLVIFRTKMLLEKKSQRMRKILCATTMKKRMVRAKVMTTLKRAKKKAAMLTVTQVCPNKVKTGTSWRKKPSKKTANKQSVALAHHKEELNQVEEELHLLAVADEISRSDK